MTERICKGFEVPISKSLKGKTIKRVFYEFEHSKDYGNEEEWSKDGDNIFIEFTDGTLLSCWNSEWGGIELYNKQEIEWVDNV